MHFLLYLCTSIQTKTVKTLFECERKILGIRHLKRQGRDLLLLFCLLFLRCHWLVTIGIEDHFLD